MSAGACEKEVEELHQFFQQWFAGTIENTDDVFSRVESVIAPEMRLICPSGQIDPAASLVSRIRQGWGHRADFVIWASDVEVTELADGLWLATYAEHHRDTCGETTRRVSSAILRRSDRAPNGVEWLHVHETWAEPQKS